MKQLCVIESSTGDEFIKAVNVTLKSLGDTVSSVDFSAQSGMIGNRLIAFIIYNKEE